ncbi:serine/threonine protein kinase [Neobacillus bataviensis LMG 21833]|uniref:non-specific serine/threonine protein kinase n=1 Tax=Neobacillus bataviensis LMG 21833 TaxID=1117379 RepID=K6DTD7_9BACI|nr:protein kinase [Neobacillus bataviensis]EKN71488.1 serine/threonine protein kinase [Neobacillus bataviensis LMG 21833]
MIKIGTIIDERYEILKEIGRGGMSIVYLAMDNRLKKSLVVKDIRKRANKDDELLINSLVIEANMLKRLDHGALPRIYDVIDRQGEIYVVMDYIEGESLKEKLKREKIATADEVIDWAKQLSDVLGYLHTRKPNPIIYRDMKPDNIMLTPEGKIKLIDFGIAREFKTENTTDTTNLGTKGYAAPEQLSGKQTDARTDIYSLGVTLYHLVTGKTLSDPPYELRPIRTWNPALPEGLEHIIAKCTHAEPDQRYQSCEELVYDLQNINKLTQGYKHKLYKKLAVFLIPAVLFLSFSTTSVLGYKGMKNEQLQDYMSLINEANSNIQNGKNAEASKILEQAIKLDKGRAMAYNNLLDMYIQKGEADKGLLNIQRYIDDGYGNINRNSEVLFKVGMTYFDVEKDYFRAQEFFNKVDPEVKPEVEYYRSLATTMGSLNIDYNEFASDLDAFEKFTDKARNDAKKIDNYNSLANIYLSYKAQIPDANTKAIKLVKKASDVLAKLDDDFLTSKYAQDFERKLAQAYYSKAINSEDKAAAAGDFEEAIDHYTNLLGHPEDVNQEEYMLKIGTLYEELGKREQAAEQFEQTVKDFPSSINAYVKLGNLLLNIEQPKEGSARNYSAALKVYEQASQLKDAANDEGFKKLTRRYVNLNLVGQGG